jgi:formylglycine-generating enzyme required for sulfatase activity
MLQRIRPGLDDFISIPAGSFLYGDNKQPSVIEKPFAIARYPVTNLQYRRFVEPGGYEKPIYWSKAGWEWRTGESDSQAQDDDEKRRLKARPVDQRARPAYWHDARWNNPLAPVVGVSWYEAEAYCNWLAAETGQPVRLPTEQEWERAARGTDGRAYPWGDDFDRNKVNCPEFWAGVDDLTDWDKWLKWLNDPSGGQIASTTLVGQMVEGNTPDGISDLSGNVWEWTALAEGRNKFLRGGSWFDHRSLVHASRRGGYLPGDGFGDVGFRPARSL